MLPHAFGRQRHGAIYALGKRLWDNAYLEYQRTGIKPLALMDLADELAKVAYESPEFVDKSGMPLYNPTRAGFAAAGAGCPTCDELPPCAHLDEHGKSRGLQGTDDEIQMACDEQRAILMRRIAASPGFQKITARLNATLRVPEDNIRHFSRKHLRQVAALLRKTFIARGGV